MPIRKEAAYIGLAENSDLRYDIIDRSPTSEQFFQVTEFPETLTAGKNVFKFRGDPDTLVDDSKIHIEILDYNGDPIYYEVLRYLEKDGTRVLAVYVYPDTPEGRAIIYLAGRVAFDPESGDRFPFSADQMSDNYKDIPNLLWLRETRVAPNRRNNSEIIMLQQPKVTIKEEVKTFSEITDLPTFFKVVKGSITDGKSISGTGPGAGYTTLTVTSTTNQVTTDIAGVPVTPIAEAQFTPRTPSRGSAAISVALPSSFANAPAVIGNTSAVNSNAISATTGLSTAALNSATANVGNSGPGGTTIGRLPPPMPAFTSPASSTPATQTNVNDSTTVEDTTVTSVSTLVFNPPDTTTITVTGFPLTSSHHLGATVVINQPKVTVGSGTHIDSEGRVVHKTATNASTGGGNRRVDCTYVGTIVDIENSTTAKLHPPFDFNSGRTNKPEGEHLIDFNASEFTMSYWVPQMSSETENSMSFANITLNNIEPATGDIFSVKTSYKLMGAPGDYIDAGNTILEKSDLLIDRTNSSPDLILGVKNTSMGEYVSQNRIDTYWDKRAGTTATFDNDYSGESVALTGTISDNTDYLQLSLKSFYSPILFKDTEYQLSFFTKGVVDANLNPSNTSVKDIRLDVYISGSAGESSTMRPIKEYHGGMLGAPLENSNQELSSLELGQYLGTVEIDADTANIANVVQFVPEDTDNYVLKFVVRKGKIYLKNVQLTANIETGFSPNTTEMNIRIPTDKMNAPMAFKFQYLDYLGAPAEVETFAQGAIFDGDNVYIEGDGNLLSGSVYIGNTVGSGIELAGVRSGYIRSVGYEGFTSASRTDRPGGFMMFTGSVLPETPDNYGTLGVGLELVQDSSSFFKFNTKDGLDIKAKTFFIGTDDTQFISGSSGNIEISSSLFHLDPATNTLVIGADAVINATLSVNSIFTPAGTNAGNARAFIDASGNAKFAGDAAGNYKAVFNSDGSATIAGWTINDTSFTGGDMIIRQDGTIESNGFASDVAGSGFRLTAAQGGFLEVENAKIRGTLGTTTFEKESVNAVGGQLYVANSTVLTGSVIAPEGIHSASMATMSVVNVTGFAANEIITAKKISNTGFATEYMLIESSSRTNSASETDLSGLLFVQRGYSGSLGTNQETGSLGDFASAAQSYSGSQVIVSTGKVGTGYIRLNANPNDPTTPYIDIVERTGSAIYDIDLKVRLGDLSGVTDNQFGSLSNQFGLYTDNVYLKGVISASAGHFNEEVTIGNPGVSTNGKILYFDDFTQYTSADAIFTGENPKTDGTGQGYVNAFSGPGEKVLVSGSANTVNGNGHILRLGNNSGNDQVWASSNTLIPFNSQSLYEIEVRMRMTAATPENGVNGRAYAGITAYKSGSTIISANASGTENSLSSQHYFALSGQELTTDFKTYRGYFQGVGSSANGGIHNDKKDPGTVTDKAIDGYIAPMFLVNYAASASISEIDYVKLTEFAQGAGSTKISGDAITTGRIKSTNLSTTKGTELSLDEGVFKVGGTGAYTSNNGILLDGPNAKFAVGNAGGNYIRFNHTANKLEINTANFDVNSAGNVTMTGTITSTAGSIGGWDIDANQLDSGGGSPEIILDSNTPKITIGSGNEKIELTSGQLRFFRSTDGAEAFRFNSNIAAGQARTFAGGQNATQCTQGQQNFNALTLNGLEAFTVGTGLFFATNPTQTADYRAIDFVPGRLLLEGGAIYNDPNANDCIFNLDVRRYFDCSTANTSGDLNQMTGAIRGYYENSNTQNLGTTFKVGVMGYSKLHTGVGGSPKAAGGYFQGVGPQSATTYGVYAAGQVYSSTNVRAAADVIAYSSDKRLKENIANIDHPLEKIKQLRGVTYDWKAMVKDVGFTPNGDGKNEMGMIAQEVQKIIPGAVFPAPFDEPEDEDLNGGKTGNPNHNPDDPYLTIKYDRIVPLLVESINAQQKLIEDMQEKIKKLENK